MKNKVHPVALTICCVGIFMVGCKPATKEVLDSQQQVEVAKENVQDANDTLRQARKAVTAEEWKAFKYSSDSIIKINDMRIAALKSKMNRTGKSIDTVYQRNIDVVEQRNENLKSKMNAFNNDVNEDWQSFKREYKHDTDELGQALKDLTVNNKK